jgi:NAD(P)-dependent dehydrogenase (short-subunit alcohol dehydrogenase family)
LVELAELTCMYPKRAYLARGCHIDRPSAQYMPGYQHQKILLLSRMAPTNNLDLSASVFAETLGSGRAYKRLQGRKILVVGAGQREVVDENPPIGNGRAMATLFAREGAAVVCLDVNKEAAENTVRQIQSEGGEAYPYIFDVQNAELIGSAVDDAKKLLGGHLDGLALVVGISRGLPLDKITKDSWDTEFAVNVRSHMLFSQHALRVMDPGAAIVILSSLAGQRTGTNPAYESSKAAQVALARAVARMGEPRGIRANAIAPVSLNPTLLRYLRVCGLTSVRVMLIRRWVETLLGTVREGRTKCPLADKLQGMLSCSPTKALTKYCSRWETAYLALFLLSHESSYISGTTINMDAGMSQGVEGRVRKAGEHHEKAKI